MVEFHVDCAKEFQDAMNLETVFGGRLSVRMEAGVRPLIKIGQDEAIQKQYSFNNKEWVGTNGQRSLVPKDEGLGIMISMYQSREFGIIRQIPPINLERINANRAGTHYVDHEAAMAVHGTTLKPPIAADESPFMVYFEYGASGKGYWNYFHTVCQLEDVMDCLKVMHPTYDFEGHFDHSSGHEKRSGAALDANDMNLGYGGAQRVMRATQIEQVEGFLGNFDPLLQVGQVQRMVFEAQDVGPFWLTPEDRAKSKFDAPGVGTTTHRKNMKELQQELAAKGLQESSWKGKKKVELHAMCVSHGITVTEERRKIIHGWLGKQKGCLQVLRERGLIDSTIYKSYGIDGKKNDFGNVIEGTNLREIMRACYDFSHEETLLQSMGAKMGITIDRSPKCQAELAGEGIEYSWGCQKQW